MRYAAKKTMRNVNENENVNKNENVIDISSTYNEGLAEKTSDQEKSKK